MSRVVTNSIAIATALLAASAAASAQTANTPSEDIRLDIAEKHITESPFERSLTADLNANELRVRIGVGAYAERIDVTLRGVTGDVRFRASLEDIKQRLARFLQRQQR